MHFSAHVPPPADQSVLASGRSSDTELTHPADSLLAVRTARKMTLAQCRSRLVAARKYGSRVDQFLIGSQQLNGFLHNGSGFEVPKKCGRGGLAR
jgi:hypothetical protein